MVAFQGRNVSSHGLCGIIRGVKIYQTLLCAVALSAAFADSQPFSRYETIIERKPFGPEPVNFDPEATPGSTSGGGAEDGEMTPEQRTAEEQQLAASVRVSMINVTPAGVVKVGFTDTSAKPPMNYYLKVGGSKDGWTVKSADPDSAAESVTLEKGGVEVTVKLGEATGGNGKGGAGGRAGSRSGFGMRRGDQQAEGGLGGKMPRMQLGGLARLRQQRMEMQAKEREAEEKKREADAVAKAEKAEREAREEEERQRAAEDRRQQREALLQIQEQLRKQREEREAANREQQGEQGEQGDANNDT